MGRAHSARLHSGSIRGRLRSWRGLEHDPGGVLRDNQTGRSSLGALDAGSNPVGSELEFIDSTGIALLVTTHRRLNSGDDVRFRLVASEDPSVRRVMTLTGLDEELPFSGSGREMPRP